MPKETTNPGGAVPKNRFDLRDPDTLDAFFADGGELWTDKALLSRLLPPREVLTEKDLESVCGGVSLMDWIFCRLTGR